MSEDPHIRHVDEFKTRDSTASPLSLPSSTYSRDTTITSNSTGPYYITTTWGSPELADSKAAKKARLIKENKEWERRLWKAKQNGRNVPPFSRL